ncbi:hypothetical protein EV385_2371 [Krasilnikovia cinnamomea]|uniref:Uncharacterized protein n=1 Tax=Krasilnikovia cinnamomea TaxID=349313 RepID=A0A4V2G6Z6_9ACTN|nr:DUF6023 family protein [Krasilnikovia cinnamomea]RZU50596.1 hypothetical protein EV385_2371 [Krasilnikovia cinnamomea]
MTGDRARGVQLYALAVALLVAGAVWWVRAAPHADADPRVAGWQDVVTRLVPDATPQVQADTLVLPPGRTARREAAVAGGTFTLTMVCAGQGQVRVRLSTSGNDTGRAVPCADRPDPVTLSVALAHEFFMLMTAETDSSAVFRWRLTQAVA